MAKSIISNECSERIEMICKRLQHSVSQIQIINWLNNFENSEWDLALTVLGNIRYFSISDIIYEFDESLKKILIDFSEHEKLYLHGLGEFGKSGSSLIYYIKKTPTFQKNIEKFKILTHTKKLKQQGIKTNGCLILVDDIIGSGNSLISYYNHNINQQLVSGGIQIHTVVLSLAYMKDAIKELENSINNLNVYGTEYIKAFASGSSVFGYRPRMLPVREFCFKYGIELFELYHRELNKKIKHPLGYNNSQSLIVFAHSVPNNTLPIIWSNKNNWQSLYPRSSHEKISQTKEFRNETLHWLSTAYQLRILNNKNKESKIFFHDVNYKLIAVIRLKKRKSIDPIICQVLGLSINELDEVYKEGLKIGIFDTNCELTIKAISIYEQLRRRIKISSTKEDRKYYKPYSEKIYVPKIFLGKS